MIPIYSLWLFDYKLAIYVQMIEDHAYGPVFTV